MDEQARRTKDGDVGRLPPLVAAARRLEVPHTPVWFMRQAGRSLPEYRAIRGSGQILEAIADPERAAEITMQPVRRYGVDGAILFSDIVVPVAAIGFGVEVVTGRGPVIERPFRSAEDLERLRPFEPDEDAPYVARTVSMVREQLEDKVALIGFAGAPFTVASYLIEGGPSRTFSKVKSMMHADPDLWARLNDALADIAIASLVSQIDAGAQIVQLFDSWVGHLSALEYEQFALGATTKVIEAIQRRGVPSILYGLGTGELLASMSKAGSDVVGVDWRIPLDVARTRISEGQAIQGNLDPAIVNAGDEVVRNEVARVLDEAGERPGHIFNLGHGVHPDTDPDALAKVVHQVHAQGRGGVVR